MIRTAIAPTGNGDGIAGQRAGQRGLDHGSANERQERSAMSSGGSSQRRTPPSGWTGKRHVDACQRALLHRAGTRSRTATAAQLAEVRIVADEHDARSADALDDVADVSGSSGPAEPVVDGDRDADRIGDELGGLARAQLGARHDRVRREPALGEKGSQALCLAPALWAQWPL